MKVFTLINYLLDILTHLLENFVLADGIIVFFFFFGGFDLEGNFKHIENLYIGIHFTVC